MNHTRNMIFMDDTNWFAVEAKSFEIKVVGEGKKAKFFITERSRGNVSWIRFGEEGLFNLLKNVEECRNASSPVTRSFVWRENGRFFRLECKENKDGRYLLCSAMDVDGKKHKLFFPEGRGFLNGWALLAEKLRGMGINRQEGTPLSSIKAVPTKEERIVRNGPSKVEVPCGGPPVVKAREDRNRKEDNTAWVDVGDCSSGKALGLLQWCLIGKWESRAEATPGEKMVEIWGREAWRLNEGLRVAILNEELLFLEFESQEEANRVLVSGSRNFRGRVLQLERWSPYYGCIRNKGSAQEEWVRLVGLPLHLWKMEVLKKIGDACGGFVAIDKNTEGRMELRWARILIKSTGAPRPSTVNILEGPRSFELQIWWEVPPWATDVYPAYARATAKNSEEGEDGTARAEWRVGFDRPNHKDERLQRLQKAAGIPDARGQAGLLGAGGDSLGSVHLWKHRWEDQKGAWEREVDRTFNLGEGLIQRADSGPTEQMGFRSGSKGPQFLGPKSGPHKQPAHTEASLVGSGPAFNETNPNAQKGIHRGPKRQIRGRKDAALGPLVDSSCSVGEKQCAVGSGGEGASHLGADPAWVCAKGPLLDADEVRTRLKDSDRFESGGNVGLLELSSKSSLLRSPYTRPTGSLVGQAFELVECGFRGSEVEAVEAAEDLSSITFGSRYETAPSCMCSSSLCSVFGRPLLSGGPSGLGKYHRQEEVGVIEPLRVVTADGIERGEKTFVPTMEAILETEGCGDEREEDPKTISECEGYDNWENSCLIKFSEFLGIPTVGYDGEILELVRRMVSQQHGNKRKGHHTETRSEKELRKLECTINYSGKGQNRGGRDRGNLLLKLK